MSQIIKLSLICCLSSASVIAQAELKNADAEINEGLSLIRARKFKEAVKAFDRARDKDPQNAFAHYGLALSLANLKEYKEAIRPLLRSLQLNPHPRWGEVTEEMVLSLLSEVQRNAKVKAKPYEITYEYDRFKSLMTVQTEAAQTSFGLYFGAGYFFSGFLPSKPDHFFLRFDSYSRDWRFLDESSRDLNLLVDARPLRLGVMERIKDKVDVNRYGVSVRERLVILISYEEFIRIAQAKVVEMQLGGSEFGLGSKQVQALRDLVGTFSENTYAR